MAKGKFTKMENFPVTLEPSFGPPVEKPVLTAGEVNTIGHLASYNVTGVRSKSINDSIEDQKRNI
jgi:hypothetical protein